MLPVPVYGIHLMSTQKLIGCPTSVWADPLVRAIGKLGQFNVERRSPAENAHGLREGRLDAALVSLIDYAREGSLQRIIPGIAVSSRGGSNTVILRFREGIHTIKTLAVDPRSVSDIILATVLLAEEFDVTPSVVPVEGPAMEMLGRADAALITGDEALLDAPRSNLTLDLVEAWTEMTELPYVHGILCCREHALTDDEAHSLSTLDPTPEDYLSTAASEAASTHGLREQTSGARRSYLAAFTYTLTDEVKEGIAEFLKYAYYHGVIPDVPELNFLSPSSPDDLLRDARQQ